MSRKEEALRKCIPSRTSERVRYPENSTRTASPWRVLLPVKSDPSFLSSPLPVDSTSAFSHDHISPERRHSARCIMD